MGQFLEKSRTKHHLLSSENQFPAISSNIDSFDAFYQTFLNSSQQIPYKIVQINTFPGKDVVFFEEMQEFGLISRSFLRKDQKTARNFLGFSRILQLFRDNPQKFGVIADFLGVEETKPDSQEYRLKYKGFFFENLENLIKKRQLLQKFYTEAEIVAIFEPFFKTLLHLFEEINEFPAQLFDFCDIFLTSRGYRAVFPQFSQKTASFREILEKLVDFCLSLLRNSPFSAKFVGLLQDLRENRVTLREFLAETGQLPHEFPAETAFFSLERCKTARLLHVYAVFFEKSRDFATAAAFFRAHRGYFSSFSLKQQLFFLTKLAFFCEKASKPREAAEIYEESLAIARNYKEFSFEEAVISSNLGSLLLRCGELQESVRFLQKTRAFCEENKAISEKNAKMINNLAEMYREIGENSQALALFMRALLYKCQILKENQDSLLVSLNNLAMFCAENGEKTAFLKKILEKLSIFARKSQEKHVFLYNLAWMCWKTDELQKSRDFLDELQKCEGIPAEIQEKAVKLREKLEFCE